MTFYLASIAAAYLLGSAVMFACLRRSVAAAWWRRLVTFWDDDRELDTAEIKRQVVQPELSEALTGTTAAFEQIVGHEWKPEERKALEPMFFVPVSLASYEPKHAAWLLPVEVKTDV